MTDDAIVGFRRPVDLMPRPEPGDDPALAERIRAEIRADGPITFARFMELALYDPHHGYYRAGARGPGRSADFMTAPESHPIFGWALAEQLDEVWERLGRPDRFTIREYGAGTGALAAGIVDGLTRKGSALRTILRYRIAERSADRESQVIDRLRAIGGLDVYEPDDLRPVVGAVIANEVLDALPVHRVIGTDDGALRELFVDIDAGGAFVSREGTPSSPNLAARLAREDVQLASGQQAEICLETDGWVAQAATGLRRGLLLLIDYGHPARALYEQSRGSLLRAYVGHRVHDDPFRNVGRQDLTAHVDFTAVEHAAAALGLDHLGTTSQAEFLTGVGAGDLLVGLQRSANPDVEVGAATTKQGSRPRAGMAATGPKARIAAGDPRTRSADVAAYLEARSALFRLLDPGATGRFGVMLFGRGLLHDPPLRGLGFRLSRS